MGIGVCEHTTPDWLLEIRAYWARVTRSFADESGRPAARGTGEADADKSGAAAAGECAAPGEQALSQPAPSLQPEVPAAPAGEDKPAPQRP